ncbi:MAG: putative toxin-antitoxin system toxin component, PIN family, partial [Patescibacteria group bacterium]|nr:putative toxin-antitoxin system toxin component, PIN family [Patescibacteria group bacterium]
MERKIKVVLDTNILISALGFGGKPREIFYLVLEKRIKAVSSPILLAEFDDVVSKKFPSLSRELDQIHRKFKKNISIVNPEIEVHILQDEPDNRVLEAAVEGNCKYIITGDKGLLEINKFKKISIVTPIEFLSFI